MNLDFFILDDVVILSFDNSRFTATITAEIMRGMLWCQCFCLLMRRELSFLSVCNFRVCPCPWQLAYVKQINPQRSLCCRASGLSTPYTLGAPRSFFSPCSLPPHFSHLQQSRGPGGCLVYFLLPYFLSLFILPSSFSS